MSRTLSAVTTEATSQVVFGADVTMTTTDGEITLHAPGNGKRQLIGRYNSVADAWRALDELDAPGAADADYRAA